MRTREAALALLSGLLLTLSYPKPDWGVLAFGALVPLIVAIESVSPLRAWGIGLMAGLVFWLGSVSWVLHSMVVYGGVPWLPSLLALAGLALYLSLYHATFAFLLRWLKLAGGAAVLGAAALWVALEVLRTHLLTGFPWNLLGYTQYRNPGLLRLAPLAGVYGVSFALVAVNAALAEVVRRWGRRDALPWAAVPATALALTAVGAPASLPPDSATQVAVIQGNMEQAVKWDPAFQEETLRNYEDLTRRAAVGQPALIVWPETSLPFVFREDPRRGRVLALAQEVQGTLIVGAPDREGNRFTNSAFVITPAGAIAGKYDKVHLVPFGEYVPWWGGFGLAERLAAGAIGNFRSGGARPVFDSPAGRVGIVICYEAIFPSEVREYFRQGADFLVNITNDAWFGDTAAPRQHLAMAAFRAAENGAYLVRAANTGISAVVGPDGRILAATSLFSREILTARIGPRGRTTLYTRYGDVFAWAAIAGVVGLVLLRLVPVTASLLAGQRSRPSPGEGSTGFSMTGESASRAAKLTRRCVVWMYRWTLGDRLSNREMEGGPRRPDTPG